MGLFLNKGVELQRQYRDPIPRTVHQTWKNGRIPEYLIKYVESWKKVNIDFSQKLWTDEDALLFVYHNYPKFIKKFESYSLGVMRSDAFRYLLMFHFGGIYSDLDYECYRSFSPLLRSRQLTLGWEWAGTPHALTGSGKPYSKGLLCEWHRYGNTIGNAVMISPSRHPFWRFVIEALIDEHPGSMEHSKRSIWFLTGPEFLTKIFVENYHSSWDCRLLPHECFYPISWHKPTLDDGFQKEDFPLAYGAHHWAGTWWQPQPYADLLTV